MNKWNEKMTMLVLGILGVIIGIIMFNNIGVDDFEHATIDELTLAAIIFIFTL